MKVKDSHSVTELIPNSDECTRKLSYGAVVEAENQPR